MTIMRGRASRFGAALMLGMSLVQLAAAQVTSAPEKATTERSVVRRSTLIVHDADASIRFYRDVLGFSVWLENRGTVTAKSLPSDAPVGAPSRFVIVKGKHPWVGMIGLLQYGDAQKPDLASTKLVPGDVVLMIETDDLDGAYERMKAAGTRILRPPETTEVTGAGGQKWIASFVFAFDPDGHLIELNQRRPAAGAAAAAAPGKVNVRRGFTDTRLGQVHFRVAQPVSPPGMSTPLVLLHQTPLSGRMFTEFLPAIATDRAVYAPDTPGYGESDVPASKPSFEQYAEALGDFVGSIGGPVDLLGYHTGAGLAAELALRHPDRVRRVILVSVPLLSDEQKARFSQPSATIPMREDGSHLVEMWKSTMSVRPPQQSLEEAARLVAEKQRSVVNTEWALASLAGYPLDARLKELKQPVLIVRPKDGLWEQTAQAAKLVPSAEIIERADWSYGIFDAYPDQIAAAIRPFLSR
jgi:pimeloyl-ACP methyl ester carboxylesterase